MPSCASTWSMPSESDAAAATAPALSASRQRSVDHVETDDPYAGRHEQLNDELTDEAEPDHARGLTELNLGGRTPCIAIAPTGRERGMFRRHTVGDRDAEVARNPVDLGVEGVVVPRARDQLADGELLGAGTDLDDDAAERVPERGVRVEPVDGASGRPPPARVGTPCR